MKSRLIIPLILGGIVVLLTRASAAETLTTPHGRPEIALARVSYDSVVVTLDRMLRAQGFKPVEDPFCTRAYSVPQGFWISLQRLGSRRCCFTITETLQGIHVVGSVLAVSAIVEDITLRQNGEPARLMEGLLESLADSLGVRRGAGARSKAEAGAGPPGELLLPAVLNVELGGQLGDLASAAGRIWATLPGRSMVVAVDPVKAQVVLRITLPGPPRGLAADSNAVWVGCAEPPRLWKIAPATGAVLDSVDLPGPPLSVALTRQAVWVMTDPRGGLKKAVVRVGRTGGTPAWVRTPSYPQKIRASGTRVFIAFMPDRLGFIDDDAPEAKVHEIADGGVRCFAVDDSFLWVTRAHGFPLAHDEVLKIDLATLATVASRSHGGPLTALQPLEGRLWLVDRSGAAPQLRAVAADDLRDAGRVADFCCTPMDVMVGASGLLWVEIEFGELLRVNPNLLRLAPE